MKRGAVTLLFILLAGIALYVASFSYIWLRNGSYAGVSVSGKQCRYVDFKYDKFTARTAILWRPGLWFMEHVCGYEDTAEIAAYDETVIFYAKPK
jgi:hypothetical protein